MKGRAEHNRKIAEGQRRAWLDPEIRARRIKAILDGDIRPWEMSSNKHGYRGVSFDGRRRSKPFAADIRPVKGGKKKRLGRYPTAELAAQAYDAAAVERYGPKAFVNFPLNGERQARMGPKTAATSCQRGHPYSPQGEVTCRTCNRQAVARHNLRALRQAEGPAP